MSNPERKGLKAAALLGCLAGIFAAGALHAQKPAPAPAQSKEAAEEVYVPPLRGAPQRRIGGASRGTDGPLPTVLVLAPDHVGLTTSEQPSLYWYVSAPTRVRVEVALVDERKTKPLVETLVPAVSTPGFHRLRLADHGVRLEEGVEYQWSVSLVPDTNERSNDVISGGVIRRVARPQDLPSRLAAAKGKDRVALLARSGLWYDAIAEVSELIDAAPADRDLHALRARMLEQIGLGEAAAFDKR